MINSYPHFVCCPACKGRLEENAGHYRCTSCKNDYLTANGIPDLSLGTRFDDESDCCKWLNEENTGTFLVESFLAPLLDKLFPGVPREKIKILSIGCGVGMDVEVLNKLGYTCYGIDPGNRTELWSKRSSPERYFLAGAENLPFENDVFDFAFMNCVLPHIGVDGDSYTVVDGFEERRQQAARESVRVVKRNGYLMTANPNRLCPLDLFHRPHITRHWPRLHSRDEPFLLSFSDHNRLFQKGAGIRALEILPLDGYWGFFLSSRYWFGRMLQRIVKGYFKLFSSRFMRWARNTWMNPWLIVLMRK